MSETTYDFPRLCSDLYSQWQDLQTQHQNTEMLLQHLITLYEVLQKFTEYVPEDVQNSVQSQMLEASSFVVAYCRKHQAVSVSHLAAGNLFKELLDGMKAAQAIQDVAEKVGYGRA